MSLLIKALNKAEEAQAEQAKSAQKVLGQPKPEQPKLEQPKVKSNAAKNNPADSHLNPAIELSLSPTNTAVAEPNQTLLSNSTHNKSAPDKSALGKIAPNIESLSTASVSAKNAANVFTAKRIEPNSLNTRLALIAGAGLIALLGMGLYYYQFVDVTPEPTIATMPHVQPPFSPSPAPPQIPAELTPTQTTALVTATPQAQPDEVATPSEAAAASAPTVLAANENDQLAETKPANNKKTKQTTVAADGDNLDAAIGNDVEETVLPENNTDDDTSSLQASFSANKPNNKSSKKPRKSKNNAPIASDSASIQVSKSVSEMGINPTLMSAYNAYNAGNDAEAQKLYKQVLKRDIHNVDALLGLGAIAARQGRSADANSWYGKVLEVDPRNSIARTSMLDNQSQGNELNNETSLKNMLAKQPDDANLHVALGNLYAEQNQWPAAQQAYFDAYSLNKTADNAYNLAVSLDQMGKPKLALPYYQRALEQANASSNMDKAALEARIAAIK